MIGSLFFWKQWDKSERIFYSIFLATFVLSVIFYLSGYYLGTDTVINWVVVSKNQAISLLREGVNLGAVTLNYNVDNYLINETFEGSDIKINYVASYLFLTFITVSMVFYLTIITTLNRFWFIVGVIIFIGLMINFKLDQLLLFGSYENIPLYVILALYLPLLYYFHAFAGNVTFFWKWLIIALLTLAVGTLLMQFASVSNPALYLVNYGILFPVIVSILFIFSVAIEVIVGILYVVTSGNAQQSKNSLLHFSIVSLIYLVNVALVFGKNRQFIDWDLYYINEFYLLLFSAVVGIWGFRHRSTLFENILPFRSNGALIYLVAAITCIATLAYLFYTGNDPLVETMEDAIIFSHLSFGFFFFLYIISNFIGPLHDNLQVYKVLYKPRHMPYYVMRFIGLVGVGGLFFQSGQLAMNQAVAGYYNGIGDLYMAVTDYYAAEQYYKLGSQFEFQNHRSNYGLASLANKQNDQASALYYYQQSILKKPTPYAYANLANVYQSSGLFFDALFSLKEGIKDFPDNAHLNNNLGLLYAKTDITDSAYLFLEKSGLSSRDVASANILSLLANKKLNFDLDSINNKYLSSDYLPVKNNLLVLNNVNSFHNADLFSETYLSDSILNPNTFAFLYNGGYNQSFVPDSTVNSFIDSYLAVSQNLSYSEQLRLSKALNCYGNGALIKAFKIIDQLQLQNSLRSGYYNNINGIWALAQHSPALAVDFFNRALRDGFEDAKLNKGFALIEVDSLEEAKVIFSELLSGRANREKGIIPTQLKLLDPVNLQVDSLSDREKYWLIDIHKYRNTRAENLQIIRQMENPYYQMLAKIDLIEHQFRTGQIDGLAEAFAEVDKQGIDDEKLARKFLHLKLNWLAAQNDLQQLEALLAESDPEDHFLKAYLTAKIAEGKDKQDEAFRAYQYIADKNPFKAHYIIDAARFFQEKIKDENLAYETILNASVINPYSIPLSKAFILQCIKMGLFSYAENELQRLATLTTPGDYQEFLNLFQSLVAENDRADNWQ